MFDAGAARLSSESASEADASAFNAAHLLCRLEIMVSQTADGIASVLIGSTLIRSLH